MHKPCAFNLGGALAISMADLWLMNFLFWAVASATFWKTKPCAGPLAIVITQFGTECQQSWDP
jgi:hypothetical protein